MNDPEYISLKHLAEQLGMDRSHARRMVLKLGIEPQKRRTPDSGNQLAFTVSTEEAARVLDHRDKLGFGAEGKVVESEAGVFYIIQLVPDLDPKRIKLGFAIDVSQRLSQHRTSAPTATILKTWPCKRSWESTVIDCLTSERCRLILNEVFECDDLNELTAKADQLFSILPEPSKQTEVSAVSPINEQPVPNRRMESNG